MERIPDFDNLRCVLRGERPPRPTLFEFFMNVPLYTRLTGQAPVDDSPLEYYRLAAAAYAKVGYDFVNVWAPFSFPKADQDSKDTISLNGGAVIASREDFERYPWPDIASVDMSLLERLSLPGNMKIMLCGPGGLLENVTGLLGYDNLCLMLYDDPDLVQDVFDAVGTRLLQMYERGMEYDSVGLLMSNDDWGFNTQTMLSPDAMRTYVFPWHKRFVACAHRHHKPAVLHSCGNLSAVMDDIIDDMGYDGKHSYEDVICPVEEMYEKYAGRIAVLGGIDLEFLCRSTPEQVFKRASAMLERTKDRGGYALGSGNSIPEYVPEENYLAMVSAVTGKRR